MIDWNWEVGDTDNIHYIQMLRILVPFSDLKKGHVLMLACYQKL